MELYAEVDRRRAERQAKRRARIIREERIEHRVETAKTILSAVIGVALLYGYLFLGFLWATT